MTRAIAKAYSLTEENRAFVTKMLLLGCFFMLLVYAWNTFSLISRTVAVQSIEKQINQMENSVHSLDSEYIKLSGLVSPEVAKEYGLKQSKVSYYIPRSTSVGTIVSMHKEL